MTTPQPAALPELPEGVTLEDLLIPLRSALNTCHDSDWTLRQFKTHITHALAALAALQSQPAAAGVSDEPEQASKVVNDSCWEFVEAMPHKIPGPIWNDLKPAIYAALIHYHRAILALRPQAVPMTELHPLMIFARECELGVFMENEVPLAARKAINAAKALGITAQGAQGGEAK